MTLQMRDNENFEKGKAIGGMMVMVPLIRHFDNESCGFLLEACRTLNVAESFSQEIKDFIDNHPDSTDEDIAEMLVERLWTW